MFSVDGRMENEMFTTSALRSSSYIYHLYRNVQPLLYMILDPILRVHAVTKDRELEIEKESR